MIFRKPGLVRLSIRLLVCTFSHKEDNVLWGHGYIPYGEHLILYVVQGVVWLPIGLLMMLLKLKKKHRFCFCHLSQVCVLRRELLGVDLLCIMLQYYY